MEKTGHLIKRVQQSIRVQMDKSLKQIDITTAQYAALNALENSPFLSNADLARACFVTPQTMTGIVKGLHSAGYIQRQAHAEHGRVIETRLSRQGRDKLTRAHELAENIEARLLSGLTNADHAELTRLLRCCAENLERL